MGNRKRPHVHRDPSLDPAEGITQPRMLPFYIIRRRQNPIR